MSIDECAPDVAEPNRLLLDQWESVCDRIRRNLRRCDAKRVFGTAAKRGSIYRWGLGVSKAVACDAVTDEIFRLAVGEGRNSKRLQQSDLVCAAESLTQWLDSGTDDAASDALTIVAWSAALPALLDELEPPVWSDLYGSMLGFRQSILQNSHPSSIGHLMIGAELALTLAWRCRRLPGASGLKSSATRALTEWGEQDTDAASAALEDPLQSRLVLASALRCQRLLDATTRQAWTPVLSDTVDQLATWVCAMTDRTGSSMFSKATRKQVKDDLGPNGLLATASKIDPDGLPGALSAALGKTPPTGRLVWQVTLPEAMHHDANAKIAVMFPDWDVRRGRTHIDYSEEKVALEVFAGRTKVISGQWQTMIETDGAEQHAIGGWSEICEYSDDDVHYLELEQEWTDGLLLQRQLMLVRDDRCLLLADSVIPSDTRTSQPDSIEYVSRLPLTSAMRLQPEAETREAFLGDDRKRALVIPLAASEWRIGPTDASIKEAPDGRLIFSSSGSGRLYAPLWLDFQKRRFKRKRTWRQLTVGDQLRLVGRDEAAGYRVQVGSEQWAVYRSLGDRACRSFLGKHLIADFFSARFCPEDGGHETLITVDDDNQDK